MKQLFYAILLVHSALIPSLHQISSSASAVTEFKEDKRSSESVIEKIINYRNVNNEVNGYYLGSALIWAVALMGDEKTVTPILAHPKSKEIPSTCLDWALKYGKRECAKIVEDYIAVENRRKSINF